MDEQALLNLVAVLRLPVPIAKGCLPRLFLNLSLHNSTRGALLRILLSLLRASLCSEEGGGSGPGASAAAAGSSTPMQTSEQQTGTTRSLEDALQVCEVRSL